MNTSASAVLAQCYPFNQLQVEDLGVWWERLEHRRCKRGQALLRSNMRSGLQLTYLVSGAAELRRSFFDRQSLQAGEDSALQPLDNLLPAEGGQIVAIDECDAVLVPRELIDEVLLASAARNRATQVTLQTQIESAPHIIGKSIFLAGDVVDFNQYGVSPLSDSDFSDEFRVSDSDVAVDWMSRFLQSPLANHLPVMVIPQLLGCLFSVEMKQGDTVIRRGESGDAMYVLTQGVASVRAASDSIFEGREIPLIPGDYFGEESLVADTVRNADVVMESDGVVAKLDRAAFIELIYPHLVRNASAELARVALANKDDDGSDDTVQLLDVRFPVESRRKPLAGSQRIPISELRAAFSTLTKERPCLVANCGGRRSELAVFLLRQAGFDAYLLHW
ncbi:MAG: cyclic nucleotide-binding domain-containing protein [Spongiibacteraceae bacterium]